MIELLGKSFGSTIDCEKEHTFDEASKTDKKYTVGPMVNSFSSTMIVSPISLYISSDLRHLRRLHLLSIAIGISSRIKERIEARSLLLAYQL